MKLGVLLLPALGLVVAGCGSGNAASSTPTPATRVASGTPPATTDPQPSATPTIVRTTPVTLPKNATPFAKGTLLLKARNYKAAQRQFKLSIKRRQRVADSYADLGTIALELGQYPAAYRAYRSAVILNPKGPPYLYQAAYSALLAQDFHGAISYASRFLTLQPSDAAGYHVRFLAYGKLLNHKAQVKDARTIVRLRPKNADAYNDLGIALSNDGKVHESITAFSQAIRLRPTESAFYINRAIAENLNKQPNLVLSDLKKARSLTRDPQTRRQLDQYIASVSKSAKPAK